MTEYKLRDGSIVQDQRLARLEEFDNKSRKYPIRALHAGKKERSYTWGCNLYLDQGRSSACVGNGIGLRNIYASSFTDRHCNNASPEAQQDAPSLIYFKLSFNNANRLIFLAAS